MRQFYKPQPLKRRKCPPKPEPTPPPPSDAQQLIAAVNRVADALELRHELTEHLAGLRELNRDLEGIATALEQQAIKSKATAELYPPQP